MRDLRRVVSIAIEATLIGWSPFVTMLAATWVLYAYGWITPAAAVTALRLLIACCAAIMVGCIWAAALMIRRESRGARRGRR